MSGRRVRLTGEQSYNRLMHRPNPPNLEVVRYPKREDQEKEDLSAGDKEGVEGRLA